MATYFHAPTTDSGATLFVASDTSDLPSVVTPTIISVGTNDAFRSDDTAVPVTGSNFVQGSTTIVLEDADGRRVTQGAPTVTDASNLTFPATLGNLQYGTITVEVTTPDGTDFRAATMDPPVGWGYVNLEAGFKTDTTSILNNYQSITPAVGDQPIFQLSTTPGGDDVTVEADGEITTYGTSTGPQTFQANIHSGGQWHDEVTITVADLQPAATVTLNPLSTTDATPTVGGTIDQNDATVEATIAGTAYVGTVTDGSWSATATSPLPPGDHDVSVKATNIDGVESTVTGTITIEALPPVTPEYYFDSPLISPLVQPLVAEFVQ